MKQTHSSPLDVVISAKLAGTSAELKLPKQLADLRNVGKAALTDFALLGISTVAQLQTAEPDELYTRLQIITHHKHDPCVWDVFAAAIHQAKTGEALDWWAFTAERKKRQAKNEFV